MDEMKSLLNIGQLSQDTTATFPSYNTKPADPFGWPPPRIFRTATSPLNAELDQENLRSNTAKQLSDGRV